MDRLSLKSYNQHRVLRVTIHSEDQLKRLNDNEDPLHLDYFTHLKNVGGHIDFRIPPEHFAKFQDLNLDYKIMIDNLQSVLDREQDEDARYQLKWEAFKKKKTVGTSIAFDPFASADDWFAGYHSYKDHQIWLANKIKSHRNIARGFSAGQTYEKREQAGIKIGKGKNNVVLHGLQHSREWITGAVVEYIIQQLLTGSDRRVARYLKKFTFHIIPIMNPDGFVVTQTTDRLHRKNTQKVGDCLGTDTNRNWDFHWNEGGSSPNPCSDGYMGPSAFSAPEAANMGNYLKNLPNVVSYIDFHAYSQLWMTPYGFNETRPANYDSYLKPLADKAVEAIKGVEGTIFTAGDIYHTIYQASGSSIDYALSVGVGAPFAVELRDTGEHGFNLPADQIIPSCKEVWAAFTAILDNLQTI
ncbi:hypothetical protein BGX34_002076 [Mortierella sp. NVP85]|nr:hypothetical protein BGX34_002076 [Mortierella sp. NVP85]